MGVKCLVLIILPFVFLTSCSEDSINDGNICDLSIEDPNVYYMDINKKVIKGELDEGSYRDIKYFDFNNNGKHEFGLDIKYYNVLNNWQIGLSNSEDYFDGYQGSNGENSIQFSVEIKTLYNSSLLRDVDYSFAIPYKECDLISNSTPFMAEESARCYIIQDDIKHGNIMPGTGDRYIGFKLKKNDTQHYGWIRVNISSNGDTLTLKDAAYELRPKLSIWVGQK